MDAITQQLLDEVNNFANFRSMFNDTAVPKTVAWSIAFNLKDVNERRAAFAQLVRRMAEEAGQDWSKAEFTLRDDSDNPGAGKNFVHVPYNELIDLLAEDVTPSYKRQRVSLNPVLYVGMPVTYRINGDRYAGVVSFVSKNGKTVRFLDQRTYEQCLETGEKWEGQGTVYTRREKRNTGYRGWAMKGQSIKSIRYSGLSFGVATDYKDPHF